MSRVSPLEVLRQVAAEVPDSCKGNIVVIGSMAAAQAYFADKPRMSVQTKDIDCLIKPHNLAPSKAEEIVQQLLKENWTRRDLGKFAKPGDAKTAEDELPVMRLYPPGMGPENPNAWFMEFLSEPNSTDTTERQFFRMVVDDEHFALASFRFFSIVAYNPHRIDELGIYYARPSMMVLTNLLHHPRIKPERMSSSFEGRSIKRSNKDLGRVLAIAYLAELEGTHDFRPWGTEWSMVLQLMFQPDWKDLANNAGKGLRSLLDSPEDLDEAHHTCRYGLLSDFNPNINDLRDVGERIYGDAVAILKKSANS